MTSQQAGDLVLVVCCKWFCMMQPKSLFHQPWQGFFSYALKIAYSALGPLELLSSSSIILDDLIYEEYSTGSCALDKTAISTRLQLDTSIID
jgi:hypothetical protein